MNKPLIKPFLIFLLMLTPVFCTTDSPVVREEENLFSQCVVLNQFDKYSVSDIASLKRFLTRYYPDKYQRLFLGVVHKMDVVAGARAYGAYIPIDATHARRKEITVYIAGKEWSRQEDGAAPRLHELKPWYSVEESEKYDNLRYAEILNESFFFHAGGDLDYGTVVRALSAYKRGRIKNEGDYTESEADENGMTSVVVSTIKSSFKISEDAIFCPLADSYLKDSSDSHRWYTNPDAVFMQVTTADNEWAGAIWFVAYDPIKDEVVLLSHFRYV
ncbi:MAG: hypothetical protein GY765_02225 [bacterium]|nr:hypothetical protein [bacterium]